MIDNRYFILAAAPCCACIYCQYGGAGWLQNAPQLLLLRHVWLPSIFCVLVLLLLSIAPLQPMASSSAVILFDGVCNLCNGFVQFVIRHDKKGHFRFTSLQSDAGQQLLAQHGATVAATPETVVLVEQGHMYTHSAAVLRILRGLGGAWRLFYLGVLLPRVLRDALYRFVARHRYQWFGQQDACMLPTPALAQRFL